MQQGHTQRERGIKGKLFSKVCWKSEQKEMTLQLVSMKTATIQIVVQSQLFF